MRQGGREIDIQARRHLVRFGQPGDRKGHGQIRRVGGEDLYFETAAVVLMKNDLNDVVNSLNLSRATRRNIKQNLFWAFFYNIIGIPIAAGVLYMSDLNVHFLCPEICFISHEDSVELR